MDDEIVSYQLDVCIEDVRALHYSVKMGIERWAGGDPEEQARLYHIRDQLQAILFDYTFHNS